MATKYARCWEHIAPFNGVTSFFPKFWDLSPPPSVSMARLGGGEAGWGRFVAETRFKTNFHLLDKSHWISSRKKLLWKLIGLVVIIDEYDYVKVFSEYNDSLSASAGVLVAVPCWLMAGCRAPLSTQHVSRSRGGGVQESCTYFFNKKRMGLVAWIYTDQEVWWNVVYVKSATLLAAMQRGN